MSNVAVVTGVLIILLVFLANPFGLWMPTELEYLTLAAVVVVAAVFAGLVTGERVRDEREEALRAHAARAGYLTGIFILTGATAVTVLSGGHADPWVLGALGAMVLVRFFVRTRAG